MITIQDVIQFTEGFFDVVRASGNHFEISKLFYGLCNELQVITCRDRAVNQVVSMCFAGSPGFSVSIDVLTNMLFIRERTTVYKIYPLDKDLEQKFAANIRGFIFNDTKIDDLLSRLSTQKQKIQSDRRFCAISNEIKHHDGKIIQHFKPVSVANVELKRMEKNNL